MTPRATIPVIVVYRNGRTGQYQNNVILDLEHVE
jgi:hypothetical protein